jgi:hypothetical protein
VSRATVVAVSRHRTDVRGRAPSGFRLYLPPEWTEDEVRWQAAGVPDKVGFAPNAPRAFELIEQAVSGGLAPHYSPHPSAMLS